MSLMLQSLFSPSSVNFEAFGLIWASAGIVLLTPSAFWWENSYLSQAMSKIDECHLSSSLVTENLSGQVCLISSSKGGGSNLTPFHAAMVFNSLQHPSKSP